MVEFLSFLLLACLAVCMMGGVSVIPTCLAFFLCSIPALVAMDFCWEVTRLVTQKAICDPRVWVESYVCRAMTEVGRMVALLRRHQLATVCTRLNWKLDEANVMADKHRAAMKFASFVAVEAATMWWMMAH